LLAEICRARQRPNLQAKPPAKKPDPASELAIDSVAAKGRRCEGHRAESLAVRAISTIVGPDSRADAFEQ
jgi:hypothetical protein